MENNSAKRRLPVDLYPIPADRPYICDAHCYPFTMVKKSKIPDIEDPKWNAHRQEQLEETLIKTCRELIEHTGSPTFRVRIEARSRQFFSSAAPLSPFRTSWPTKPQAVAETRIDSQSSRAVSFRFGNAARLDPAWSIFVERRAPTPAPISSLRG
jgi:hypothetical protein